MTNYRPKTNSSFMTFLTLSEAECKSGEVWVDLSKKSKTKQRTEQETAPVVQVSSNDLKRGERKTYPKRNFSRKKKATLFRTGKSHRRNESENLCSKMIRGRGRGDRKAKKLFEGERTYSKGIQSKLGQKRVKTLVRESLEGLFRSESPEGSKGKKGKKRKGKAMDSEVQEKTTRLHSKAKAKSKGKSKTSLRHIPGKRACSGQSSLVRETKRKKSRKKNAAKISEHVSNLLGDIDSELVNIDQHMKDLDNLSFFTRKKKQRLAERIKSDYTTPHSVVDRKSSSPSTYKKVRGFFLVDSKLQTDSEHNFDHSLQNPRELAEIRNFKIFEAREEEFSQRITSRSTNALRKQNSPNKHTQVYPNLGHPLLPHSLAETDREDFPSPKKIQKKKKEKKLNERVLQKAKDFYEKNLQILKVKQKQMEQSKRLRKQAREKECTFKPKLHSNREFESELNFLERSLQWQMEKELKLRERRKEKKAQMMKNCTFKPSLNKQSDSFYADYEGSFDDSEQIHDSEIFQTNVASEDEFFYNPRPSNYESCLEMNEPDPKMPREPAPHPQHHSKILGQAQPHFPTKPKPSKREDGATEEEKEDSMEDYIRKEVEETNSLFRKLDGLITY